MHKSLRGLVALSLAGMLLTACGQAAPVGPASVVNATGLAAQSASSTKLAQGFANAAKLHNPGKVKVSGSVVTITTAKGGAVAYDFSNTPKTHTVTVTSDKVSVEVAYDKLLQTADNGSNLTVLPAVIVPIAIDMVVAGAKAYVWYRITHRGDNYNKHDAIQTTVTAMAQALVAWVPMGQYMEWLVPIVVNVLMNTSADDYKQIYHAMMDKLDSFVDAIKHILHKDPAPPAPAY